MAEALDRRSPQHRHGIRTGSCRVRTDLCRCEGSGAGQQDYGSLRFGSDSGDATPSNVSVNFTEESKTVTFGDEFTVRVVTSPANAEVKWGYENEDVIAFADPAENYDPQVSHGEMTYKAVGAGSSEIYVKIYDPAYEDLESAEDVLKVTVNKLKLELETSSLSLEVSKQQKLPLTTKVPAGTILNWSSDKESVAKVDQSGNVTAVAEGTATITVSADHCEPASCTVTVGKTPEPAITELKLEPSELLLTNGQQGDAEGDQRTGEYRAQMGFRRPRRSLLWRMAL